MKILIDTINLLHNDEKLWNEIQQGKFASFIEKITSLNLEQTPWNKIIELCLDKTVALRLSLEQRKLLAFISYLKLLAIDQAFEKSDEEFFKDNLKNIQKINQNNLSYIWCWGFFQMKHYLSAGHQLAECYHYDILPSIGTEENNAAKSLYEQMTAQGYIPSMIALANAYAYQSRTYCPGISLDYAQALAYYEMVIARPNATPDQKAFCYFNAAKIYQKWAETSSTPQEKSNFYLKAQQYLSRPEVSQQPLALTYTGENYLNRRVSIQKQEDNAVYEVNDRIYDLQAYQKFAQAINAQIKDPEAIALSYLNLGDMALRGQIPNTLKNPALAQQYYQSSNTATGDFRIATMYERGEDSQLFGTPSIHKDLNQACQWYESSFKKLQARVLTTVVDGYRNTQNFFSSANVRTLHQESKPVSQQELPVSKLTLVSRANRAPKDQDLSVESVATSDVLNAKLRRALGCYQNGDIDTGFGLLVQIAHAGLVEGMYQLGMKYLQGKTVIRKVDYTNATHWLAKAAEKDHPYALHQLYLFYKGTQINPEVKPDLQQAVEHVRRAANRGRFTYICNTRTDKTQSNDNVRGLGDSDTSEARKGSGHDIQGRGFYLGNN